MLLQTVVTALGCLAVVIATTAEAYQVKGVAETKLNQHFNISEINQQKNTQNLAKQVAAKSQFSYMKLEPEPTGKKNAVGNPIYLLHLYADGELIRTYQTVTGRSHTQYRNRHKSGTEAPLPNGKYKVAKTPIPGTIREAGSLFLPIQPLFSTGRSALGIHYDPSFEKRNGEDGTSGCIGLVSQSELNQLLKYVREYQPKYLKVDI